MTIQSELDDAINAASRRGVSLAAMTIRAGTPAWRALALPPDADTGSYRAVAVKRTADHEGWELVA